MFSRLHNRRARRERDPEAGGGNLGRTTSSVTDDSENLPEYVALDRYISTYREKGAAADDTQQKKKKPWWKFWQTPANVEPAHRPPGPGGGTPTEWLDTDIKTGIRSDQVEDRRKATGWNELVAEKENLYFKFLGYFTGPILYGKWFLSLLPTVEHMLMMPVSYGTCRPVGRWSRRLG